MLIYKPILYFSTYEKTTAVVTDVNVRIGENSDGEQETYYDIYVRYETKTGEVKDVKLPDSDSSTRVGDKKTVYYDLDRPDEPMTISSMFIAPGIALVMGLIFLGVSLHMIISDNKKSK